MACFLIPATEAYFQIFDIFAEKSKSALRKYLTGRQQIVLLPFNKTKLNMALICWHPQGKDLNDT